MNRLFLTIVGAVFVLTSCTSGGSEDGPAAGPFETEPESDSDLDERMLSVADLPAGWSVDPDAGDEEDSPFECAEEVRELAADQPVSRSAFVRGTDVPAFGQQLISGTELFDQIVEIYDGCESFTDDIDGSEVEGSLDAMSVDPVEGVDDLRAWRLALSIDGVAVEGYLTVSTHGDALMALVYLDVFSADLAEFTELVELAASKA